MTPSARIAAAISILDDIQNGTAAEKTLTTWARQNRYAGSGDRAAIRDLVFDALRRKSSLAWLGQGWSGRALMIGALRARGEDPGAHFTGQGYAPPVLTPSEMDNTATIEDAPCFVRLDCPEWLWTDMALSLGETVEPVLTTLQSRADVFLRVNAAKTDVEAAVKALAQDDIACEPHALSPTALRVTKNPRRVQNSQAFKDGLVELQDAASQAVVDHVLPFAKGKTVLDYCAGGGGKSLALAVSASSVNAHDANPARMKDIPNRAERAGVTVTIDSDPEGPFDLVLCDVPCSGTGAWRRQPDAKWRMTRDRLNDLQDLQGQILKTATGFVGEGGCLAYMTCSLLRSENEDRVADFLNAVPGWTGISHRRLSPLDGGDGFFVAVFQRTS